MTQHNEGDTVEVSEGDRTWVGEYKGIEPRTYGDVHVVYHFKENRAFDIPVESQTESVNEYSVI